MCRRSNVPKPFCMHCIALCITMYHLVLLSTRQFKLCLRRSLRYSYMFFGLYACTVITSSYCNRRIILRTIFPVAYFEFVEPEIIVPPQVPCPNNDTKNGAPLKSVRYFLNGTSGWMMIASPRRRKVGKKHVISNIDRGTGIVFSQSRSIISIGSFQSMRSPSAIIQGHR